MTLKILAALLALGSAKAFAVDMTVIDVRRNITLSEEDTVYKDFYINGNTSNGLKKNMVVTAIRKLNIRDASGANAYGEIQVPVGKLKIIAIYGSVAVAREFELLSRDELPMLEQIGIMNGDRIDLQGAFIDNSKPKAQRKVAAAAPQTQPTQIAAVAVVTAPPSAPAVTAPAAPVIPAISSSPEAQKLEKTADSGNTTVNE